LGPLEITILFFSCLTVVLFLGLPVTFAVGGVSIVFILWQLGLDSLFLLGATTWASWTNYLLITVPMFILMALFLEKSGMANSLYDAMYKWMGILKGGLAVGTIIICAIFAAMAGNSAVGTLTMGLVALPSMFERGYNKQMVIGSVAAGGTLGILIPPSIPMIVYGFLAQESVGQLFMGGVLPGIMLTLMFVGYIVIICMRNPQYGPAISREERATWKEKLTATKSLILPVLLIIMVLGFMYFGITTATEAAGVGAFGAFICVLLYRRFSWKLMHDSLLGTLRLTGMVGWILLSAALFTHVYSSMGAGAYVTQVVAGMEVSKWLILWVMIVIVLIMGCFLDPAGITTITVPVFVPICKALGFDLVWFGIVYVMSIEVGYLTPPFGINLFYMKMLVPKGITMGDIYAACIPFVVIMIVAIAIVVVFPQLALWLPGMMMK
jgi:tripartite ATP-independent transporter DctM subunit